jgi:phosphatidylglycerophosphatase A
VTLLDKEMLHKATLEALDKRKVNLFELAKILYTLQSPYISDLTVDECHEHILKVLEKREVQYAILTGIAIDELAEHKKLPQPLQKAVETDDSLYGIDEILALSIVQCYGSIAFTNFGYLDKTKPSIIGDFNNKDNGEVHTFLDDLLSAVIAAAASRLAHNNG